MPYKIRKQKCKQSDGDAGTYVLSYTTKKGKKIRNCHTSKKKARGQIAAIEGPPLNAADQVEGEELDENEALVREWVRETLIESKQSRLDSSKLLGYVAEWATWESLTGEPGYDLAVQDDRRISDVYNSASPDERRQFQDMYDKMVSAANQESANIRSETGLSLSSAKRPDMGTATEKVDVVTSDADVHVKFNDASRLAGFQRAKSGVPPSKTAVVYDSVVDEFGNSLDIDERFIDSKGFLRRPKGVKGMSKMSPAQKKVAEKLRSEFQNSRDEYRLAFTNLETNSQLPGYRLEFIEMLDKAGIREAILEDINDQLMGGSDRGSIYFKYFTSGNNVRLDTHRYILDDLKVVPSPGETTNFYTVTDGDEQNKYFYIEFRLDGGGHPPQLKVGPDLDKK